MPSVKRGYNFNLEERREVGVSGGAKGSTSVPTGRLLPVTIEVEVDIDAIANSLVQRAAKSKSGKCSYMEGKVKVRVVGTRPVLLIRAPTEPAAPPLGSTIPARSERIVDL